MNLILVTIFSSLFVLAISPQELRPIFDARRNPSPTKATLAEEKLLQQEILPAAKKYWEQDCECENFNIIDVADGAFTAAGTKQRAILYLCCTLGHGFTRKGIAFLDSGKVVAHVVYDGIDDIAIGALPDIDTNGKSEILIANFYMNTGSEVGGISIIELGDKEVRKLGQATTYEGNCSGQVNEKKGKTTAYKVYVVSSSTPQFYAETFIQRGCNSKDEKLGAIKKTVLDKDETDYHRIK